MKQAAGALVFLCGFLISTSGLSQVRDLVEPDVMLVIDSSGSMDWRDNTNRPEGMGPWDWARQSCEANLYSQQDKTSWQKLQDAFLGKIPLAGYHCSVEEPKERPSLHALRDENIGDYVPNHITEYQSVFYPHFHAVNCPQPPNVPQDMWQEDYGQCIDNSAPNVVTLNGMTRCYNDSDNLYTAGVTDYCLDMHPERGPRQSNGILDTFGTNVRFGAMTYDNLPKCWGPECAADRHATRWDYGMYRNWDCGGIDNTNGGSSGNVCYEWNAGARGGAAEGYVGALGGMVGIGRNAESTNSKVAKLLDSVEPLYCSPLASMVDDLGYYFAKDQNVLPPSSGGTDQYYRCRPKIAVLITDGQPTPVFEFPSGQCTDSQVTPSDWDPMGSERHTHEESGPPFTTVDNKVFGCPWRSAPEEASEVFDVGHRVLQRMGVLDVTNCKPPACWPVLLVVVGFNVPEVDCEKEKDRCYHYTPDYTPCWDGIPKCEPNADAGPDDETLCTMTPRQFVNEIACQGWPWSPASITSTNYGAGGSVTHETGIMPPWLDEETGLCSDADGDFICKRYEGSVVDRALFVQDSDELTDVLDMILVEMSSTVATRTDLVVWNKPTVTGFTDAAVSQYEFRTGYVPQSGRPWKGVFTRKDQTCGGNETTGLHNVAQMIGDQGQERKILSYYSAEPNYTPLNITQIPDWLNHEVIGVDGLKRLDDGTEFTDCAFGVGEYVGDESLCGSRTDVADIIRNETLDRGLADIYNSTPAVLGPPYDRLSSASYQVYRNSDGNKSRAPYIFVGTNDGVLHAVDIDEISSGPDAAPEKWGFIPKSLLKELMSIYPIPPISVNRDTNGVANGYELSQDQTVGLYRHEFLLDGPPVARDVLLIRRASEYDAELEKEAWRAVVFGSSGRNARTHYALDVTETLRDPSKKDPKLRWEINPDEGMYGNNDTGSAGRDALDEMGMPVSKPAVAYVRQEVGTSKTQMVMAAAIVPGGWKENADPNASGTDRHQNGGTGVYVLRLADGNVIRYLDPKEEDDICTDGVGLIYEESAGDKDFWDGAQLIGEPVIPNGTRALNVTTHAFIGDDRGRIWLIDMDDPDPDKWCLNIYFDTLLSWNYPYQDCVDTPTSPCSPSDNCVWTDCCKGDDAELPCAYKARNMKAPRSMLIGAPAVAQNADSQDVLVFGTGQYDELTQWNRNRVFSITDTIEPSSQAGKVNHKPRLNWWVGDPIPAEDPFEGLPGSAGTVVSTLREFQTMMEDHKYVNFTDYPREGTGPQAFWNVGEKLIGRPVIFDEVVYFTTFIPLNDKMHTDDACDEGASRVWALDYDTFDINAEPESPDYIGKFFRSDTSVWVPFYNYYHQLLSGVKVKKKPQCKGIDAEAFELVVQTANPAANVGVSGAPPANAVQTMSIPISKRNSVGLVSVRFDSWSIVF
jgi:hypothetical protein